MLGSLLAVLISTAPFRLIDHRIFVNASINGRGPFNCLLDTGANAAIDGRLIPQLGVSHATLDRVSIGPIHLSGVGVNVVDLSDEHNVFGAANLDLILGVPLFERYIVRIDYASKTVDFYDPHSWRYRGHGLRVRFTRPDQIPIVDGTIDGVPARFGIDTGARSSLLLYTPFVSRNHLVEKYRPTIAGITGWGIGGPIRTSVARAQLLAFGGLRVTEPVVRLSSMTTGVTAGTHIDGLIGADVLMRNVVYVNYGAHELIFEPSNAVRDSFDKLGAWIGTGSNGFVVLDVYRGSPADRAGLETGDAIVSIDGVPAGQLDLPAVRDRFRDAPAGTVVSLIVRRGNGKMDEMKVTLRDLV